MNEAVDFHRQAMEAADQALLERLAGRTQQAREKLKRAFELERRAALALGSRVDLEPTRSVLFRSAASLGLECEQYREAERLVALGLSGDPPEEIADELRHLLDQINFHRHLSLKGVVLEQQDLQMSLVGHAIGYGFTPTRVFQDRVSNVDALIYRTAERLLDRPYRDSGRRTKEISSQVSTFLSAPRAASFAITFRIGRPEQPSLPGMDWGPAIVEDLLDLLESFNAGDINGIRQRIPDESYRRNFLAIARKLAPDGDMVSGVAFSGRLPPGIREVALTVPRKEALRAEALEEPKEEMAVVVGKLLFADETKDKSEIRLVDREGKVHRVRVPDGLMADIVKPLWDEEVRVTGVQVSNVLHLEDIERVDDTEEDLP